MKKFLLILSVFVLNTFVLNTYLYAQEPSEPGEINANVYFNSPTPGQTFYIGTDGRVSIPYSIRTVSQFYYVDKYYARLQHPNGTWTTWQEGQTGGWIVEKAGTYHIQGAVHVIADAIGHYNFFLYSDIFEIYVVDNYSPATPANLQITQNSACNPVVVWNANTEADLNGYEIWKKWGREGGDWHLKATISQSSPASYTDVSETIYVGDGRIPPTNVGFAYYKIKAADINGNFSGFSNQCPAEVYIDEPSKQNGNKNIIVTQKILSDYALSQNYPNPFNPSTIITYQVKEKGLVSLKVFDLLGKQVADLVNDTKEAGCYSVTFNADNLPSGIYVYSIKVNNFVKTNKMSLIK